MRVRSKPNLPYGLPEAELEKTSLCYSFSPTLSTFQTALQPQFGMPLKGRHLVGSYVNSLIQKAKERYHLTHTQRYLTQRYTPYTLIIMKNIHKSSRKCSKIV